MDENSRRRNLQNRHNQRLSRSSYEDVSQLHQNSISLKGETPRRERDSNDRRNTDSDSGEDEASFENALAYGVSHAKKSSGPITPR